ncbi:MAG: LysR family transcriptional regulator [Parashewanella sp.]
MNHSFDLNLLRVLSILLEEKNVTQAAKHLNLTQSAVSKHLAKLRIMFDDPLLVRMSGRLNTTPKANELAIKLKPLLLDIEQLTRATVFDASQSHRRFKIDMIELAYASVIAQFMPEVLNIAPDVEITFQSWDRTTIDRLIKAELDFGITCLEWDERSSLHVNHVAAELSYTEIKQDHSVCLARQDHPLFKKDWDLDSFLEYRHIQVVGGGTSKWLLDEVLAQQKIERNIAIEIPDFQGAIRLCESSDLLLCAPYLQVKDMIKNHRLKVLDIPLDLVPGAFFLLWNKHYEKDLGHKWLRELIIDKVKNG